MAVGCVTVLLPNHKICYCKMHRLLTCKEFVHNSCVQQFYTIKIKSLKVSAYFATRIHITFFFFCSLHCFKKILNVKPLRWRFCRKPQIASFM